MYWDAGPWFASILAFSSLLRSPMVSRNVPSRFHDPTHSTRTNHHHADRTVIVPSSSSGHCSSWRCVKLSPATVKRSPPPSSSPLRHTDRHRPSWLAGKVEVPVPRPITCYYLCLRTTPSWAGGTRTCWVRIRTRRKARRRSSRRSRIEPGEGGRRERGEGGGQF